MRILLTGTFTILILFAHAQPDKNMFSFSTGYGISIGGSDFENSQTLNPDASEQAFSQGGSQGLVALESRLGGLGKGLNFQCGYERLISRNFSVIGRLYYHDVLSDKFYQRYDHAGSNALSRITYTGYSYGGIVGIGIYATRYRFRKFTPYIRSGLDISAVKMQKEVEQVLIERRLVYDFSSTLSMGFVTEIGTYFELSDQWHLSASLMLRFLAARPEEARFTFYENGQETLSPEGYTRIVYGSTTTEVDRNSQTLSTGEFSIPMSAMAFQIGITRFF